jgi:hypothetical protein
VSVIDRPEVSFDAEAHAYKVEGEDVLGVSTIAKVGGVEDSFNIASAWGFRVGYEGAFDVLDPIMASRVSDPWPSTKDDLRAELKKRGLTPWSKRDNAAERGSWVHDVLEELGQDGAVPDMGRFPEEVRGHATSVLRFFLHYRPRFVAMEVQVASREHRFAGRYDVRCLIDARRLLACIDPLRQDPQAVRVRELAAKVEAAGLALDHREAGALVLLDLKTSKGIYPETHFPQLEGYELAGVEMGYPETDARAVLNTWPDGDFDPARDLAVSWSNSDDFVAFAHALRAIRRIKGGNPELIREKARADFLLGQLPARSRDLAQLGAEELKGMDAKAIGRVLGSLRKRRKCHQPADARGEWHPGPGEDG